MPSLSNEPWVAHLSRLPKSLDDDLRRIAALEDTAFADVERQFLKAMVDLYDTERRLDAIADR